MQYSARYRLVEKTVIVDAGGQRVGFGVDKVIGQYQTVVKNMGRYYKNVKYVSGATIMGNGTVALILDLNRIVWGLQEQISEKERSSWLQHRNNFV